VEAHAHQAPESGPEETPGLIILKPQRVYSAEEQAHLASIRALAKLMDAIIPVPGTGMKIGADALLGLIPGVGDLGSAAIGAYILNAAAKLGVPPVVLARMVLNLAIDALLGLIPFAGDLFDVMFKANMRNVKLVEEALADPTGTRRSSRWVLIGLLGGLLAITATSLIGAYFIARWLWSMAS
jgi:hypothetical protein